MKRLVLIAICAIAVMISCKGKTEAPTKADTLAAVIDSIIEEADTTPMPMFLMATDEDGYLQMLYWTYIEEPQKTKDNEDWFDESYQSWTLQEMFRHNAADYTNLLALTGYLTQDSVQVEEMFRRMVMNLVALNRDDHAKNFSFICDDGKWSLAPAYDITYSPKGTNGEHATSLFYDGNPGLDLVLKAGTGIRIPKARCLEIIDRVEEVCERNLPVVAKLRG